MLVILFILSGILARFIPHAYNFSPLAAIALFSGAYLKKRDSLIVPLGIYIISDLFLGLHRVVFFSWGAILLIALLGWNLRKKRNVFNVFGYSLLSAVLFFLITNFGVWAMGYYERSLPGLLKSYIMGIPFFRASLASNLVYSLAIFGLYEILASKIKQPSFRKVLFIEG